MSGTLYLIPTDLGGESPAKVIPEATREALFALREFIVENGKTARAFLKTVGYPYPLQETPLTELNEHTQLGRVGDLLAPLRAGRDVGLLSEAGCPCIADPGSQLVGRAQQEGFVVKPLVGPSAILMALIASGLQGQAFRFVGYLPVDERERRLKLVELEAHSSKNRESIICIETPYRTDRMFASILAALQPETLLCVATNLTMDSEAVITRSIREWRESAHSYGKEVAVFVFQAAKPEVPKGEGRQSREKPKFRPRSPR